MMMTHQEVLHRALELKAEIEDLRSATYIVDQFTDSNGTAVMFIAAFDMDSLSFSYTVTDPNFIEIKGIGQISPETAAAYGVFVQNMLNYEKGGEHPYKDKLAAFNPEIIKPHDLMDQEFPDDRGIDDSAATLK